MRRRTLLQTVVALLVGRPVARLKLLAQAPARLTGAHMAALAAMAEVVLPRVLSADDRTAAVDRFVRWHEGYREGAATGHSYGSSRVTQPTGPSPAAKYPAQFAALDELARARGAASFAGAPVDERRAVIEAALEQPARVTSMPSRPNGASLIADFMGYYFASEQGYDLAYDAAIGRDTCRGLKGSERPPAPLRAG